MDMDELIERHPRRLIFLRDMTEEDIWCFYALYDIKDFEAKWMDSVYGFHMRGIRESDNKQVDIYSINLKACYDYEHGYYSIKCLVGTVLHELLHKFSLDERSVRYITKRLLTNYKYSRIRV